MTKFAKIFSRKLLLGALILLLFTASCNLPSRQTPPPVSTILPTGTLPTTPLAANTLNSLSPTVSIPVTGSDIVSLQCEFCVNDQAHAVLLLSEQATFIVSNPVVGINCMTAQVVNGRRIVFCRGPQQTTFTLNICVNNSNCTQFPVTLESCSAIAQGVMPTQPTFSAPTAAITSPAITLIAPTMAVSTVTPIPTQVSPTVLPSTVTPVPTQTSVAPPLSSPTAVTHAQPTRPTAVGSQQPGAIGVVPQDPGEFVRWYFNQVWTTRNYQQLWDNYLTLSFKSVVSPGGFAEYTQWWGSVQRVDVNSVNVIQNNGAQAWVRVNVTFTMNDGRVISNQEYDYSLTFDPTRQTWMFDLFP